MAKVLRYKFCAAAVWSIITMCYQSVCFAQSNHQLIIHTIDENNSSVVQSLNLKTSFQTKFQCSEYIAKLPALLQSKGYLASSIDSVSEKENSTQLFLFLGENYQPANIRISSGDEMYLNNAGWRGKNRSMNFLQYTALQQKLLDYFFFG